MKKDLKSLSNDDNVNNAKYLVQHFQILVLCYI